MSRPPREGLLTTLVLAASRGPQDPVAQDCAVSHKCLVKIAGKTMLERVLETLAQCPSLGRIAIVVDPQGRDAVRAAVAEAGLAARSELLASANSPSESVLAAIDQLESPFPLLITTADSPLMTVEMVEFFCAGAWESGADLAIGLAEGGLILSRYPEAKRTFLRFRGGRYSGCNLFALTAPKTRQAVTFWVEMERYRKRPWRLIAALGLGPLLAYLAGRLSLRAALDHASARLGVDVREVIMPYPTAAMDVDKPADLALAESILGSSEATQSQAVDQPGRRWQ